MRVDAFFGQLELGAASFVLGQPLQVGIAQRGPGDGEGHEFARLQAGAERLGGGFGGGVDQGQPVGIGRNTQRFVKAAQRVVQPVAPIALVDVDVQLALFGQAQLAQREEAVGAGAQHLVAAGGQRLGGQCVAARLRAFGGANLNETGLSSFCTQRSQLLKL